MSAALVEPQTEDKNGMSTYPISDKENGDLSGGKIVFVSVSERNWEKKWSIILLTATLDIWKKEIDKF